MYYLCADRIKNHPHASLGNYASEVVLYVNKLSEQICLLKR